MKELLKFATFDFYWKALIESNTLSHFPLIPYHQKKNFCRPPLQLGAKKYVHKFHTHLYVMHLKCMKILQVSHETFIEKLKNFNTPLNSQPPHFVYH